MKFPVYEDSESSKVVGYFNDDDCAFNRDDSGCNIIIRKTSNGYWIGQWFGSDKHFLLTKGKAVDLMETYGIDYDIDEVDLPML